MHVFIDGYNAIFSSHEPDIDLKEARELFLKQLKTIKSLSKNTTVVFDAKNLHFSKIESDSLVVVYTEKNQSADTYILEQIELTKQKGQILVVSNDRELKQKAQTLGAKTQSFSKFYKSLRNKTSKKEEKPTSHPHELGRYLNIFEKRSKK